MEITFNETEYIENNLLNVDSKPTSISINRLIKLLSKYYYRTCSDYKPKQFVELITKQLNSYNMPLTEYEEYKYTDYIKRIFNKMRKGEMNSQLKEINQISITKSEIDVIRSVETEKEQKVLFTLYVLAKSILNPTGWVNYPENAIFDYANVRATHKERMKIFRSLYVQEVMGINNIIDKDGYKVELGTDTEDIEMTITNFCNFGNQYLNKYKDGWKMCENCERMIKVKANSQRYCKKCAEIITAENKKKWDRTNKISEK